MVFLWRRKISLFHEVQDQKKLTANAELLKDHALADAKKWKNEASNALKGLSDAIDAQLTRWQLTTAEKEVALLLLKGLSLKEVAEVRNVSEKTARAQSFAVYAKSGLSGRAELSAFFLEDLMLPTTSTSQSIVKDLSSRPNSFI
ncbi:MAG: helix-turn-helix transcriptional regulator [Bdellovibrio sp.]|nr:helix-turn-helix transcriptional regulator [Bdellovibrio sp.]